MLDDPPRYLPYPELVERSDQRDYEIHDSRFFRGGASLGMVSKVDRVMLVPLCEEGLSVRRHEMAHVRWSPRSLPKTGFDELILMAVEDARIDLALQARGLSLGEPEALRERALQLAALDLERRSFALFILRCIASIGSDLRTDMPGLARASEPDVHALAVRLVDMVEGRLERSRLRTGELIVAPFAAAVRVAATVAEELARAQVSIGPDAKRYVVEAGGLCLSCRAKGAAFLHPAIIGAISAAHDVRTAEMRIAEPDLHITLAQRGRRPGGVRSALEGALVRSAHRWFNDKRVFRARARCRGGTVLIDTSSSMRFDANDIDSIVRGAPSATLVAIYSGRQRAEGELRIIVRGGKRAACEDLTPYGPGNMIDLPALQWLAKQPSPRVWVSDARVTGVNDVASRIIARRCRVVCLKHNIRRAENAEGAAAILEGRQLRRLPLMV